MATTTARSGDEWIVWKFGGTSVANAERLINVANLICQYCWVAFENKPNYEIKNSQRRLLDGVSASPSSGFGSNLDKIMTLGLKERNPYRLAVVISAMAGITDALQSSCDEAAMEFHRRRKCSKNEAFYGKLGYCQSLEEVRRKHFETVDELLSLDEIVPGDAETFKQIHEEDISKISEILKAFSLSGTCPISLREVVMGHGELWSSRLLFSIVKKRQSKMDNINDGSNGSIQANGVIRKEIDHSISSVKIDNDCPLETTTRQITGKCDFCLPCPMHEASGFRCCETKGVRWIDARQILVIKDSLCSAGVYEKVTLDFSASETNIKDWLKAHPMCRVAIITGYICSTQSGIPATLKRNGSDYSGSLFANLLKAKLYTVWSDVDGVYTADPRKVPTAFRLPFVSYIEAIELAYFGAKVLHPSTMEPCISADIPILLRSSIKPESPGTLIGVTPSEQIPTFPEETVQDISLTLSAIALRELNPIERKKALAGSCKAFTLIDNISLINVVGTSMIGVPGIASRVFAAVHEANCSVVMISQASSEHSICFAVLSSHVERAKAAVEAAFYKEMHHDKSMSVSDTNNCTIICAVGERMCGHLGILGQLSTSLANAEVNVKAVTQGASEINITFVVETDSATRAIRAMHDGIYRSHLLSSGIQTRSPSDATLTKTTTPSTHVSPSLSSVARHSNNEEDCIRLAVFVPYLPLPPTMEFQVLQIASDIHRRSIDPSPLERHQGLPVRIVAYTDGIVYLKKLQAFEASTFPIPLANDLLLDNNCRSPFVLVDLRGWISPSNFDFPHTSYTESILEIQRSQSQFIQQWKSRGRIVIDSSSQVQVAPALDSLIRMVSNLPRPDPDDATTTDDSSMNSYSDVPFV